MNVNHYYYYKVIVIGKLGLQWIDSVRLENDESDFVYNIKI